MKKTEEVEIKVGGRILGFTDIGDGIYRFVIETNKADTTYDEYIGEEVAEVNKKSKNVKMEELIETVNNGHLPTLKVTSGEDSQPLIKSRVSF